MEGGLSVSGGGGTLQMTVGGVAVVCCVHDREKRQIVTEEALATLLLEHGYPYDPAQHKIFECACCGNLFVRHDDMPQFCGACTSAPVHALGGPLPDPTGAIA